MKRVEQRFPLARREKPGCDQVFDRLAGVDGENAWRVGRVAKLEILGDELDVDQAATPVLDIPRIARRMFAGDAAAHVGDVGDEFWGAPRPRQDFADSSADAPAELGRAGNRPRAGERHVLPCPGRVAAIADEPLAVRGDRPFGARGAEPHVDFIEAALAGERGHRVDEPVAEPRVIERRRQWAFAVGDIDRARHVIDEDQVEIGRHRHFAPAELAQRDDHELGARQPAVLADEVGFDRGKQRHQHALGDIGQRRPGRFRRRDPAQELDANLKSTLRVPAPHEIEYVLKIARLGEHCFEIGHQTLEVRRRGEEAGAQHAVEEMRMFGQRVGEPWRAAHDLGDQVEESRIGVQQRKNLHARGKPREEFVELEKGRVGLRRACQRLEQGRHQLGQDLAGPRAAHRAHAAMVPAANRAGDLRTVDEAQLGERLDRSRVVLGAGEDEITRAGERWRLLEQPRVMTLDTAQMAKQPVRESPRVGKAEERRKRVQRRSFRRQAVGLLVVDHLQAMFDATQEAICLGQLIGCFGLDAAHRDEARQRIARRGDPQRRLPAAPDELLGLGEEFDLADAAAADLDVMAAEPDHRAAMVGMDLAFDRMDVLDRREIEVLAPDVRPQLGEKRGAGGAVARHRPRLDHRRPFPVLAKAFVIDQGRGRRHGRRGRTGIGPQPQIGAKDVALGGALLQDLHQPAGQTHEPVLKGVGLVGNDLLVVVQNDNVDIARIVELARAKLAHGDDRQPGITTRIIGIRQFDRSGIAEFGEQMPNGEIKRQVGEVAKRGGHPFERPKAGDIGKRYRQRRAPLGDPQAGHQRAHVGGPREASGHVGEKRRHRGIRAIGQQVDRKSRLAQQAVREIGRVAKDCQQQPTSVRVGRDRPRPPGAHALVVLGDRFLPLGEGQFGF